MADLDAVFKAYDIRGLAPEQLDPELTRAVGVAFARFVNAGAERATRVLVARDMRPSGVELAAAFA
jgi:phosphomannomutase